MKSNQVLIFGILKIVTCQVNQEIYSEEDLLAIDSEIHNEVVVAFAPPPSAVLPAPSPSPSKIDLEQNFNALDGSHSFSYSLPDGTKHTQAGYFTPTGYVLTGSWEYFGQDGQLFKTEFIADKDGYRPRILPAPVQRKRTSKKIGFKNKRPFNKKKNHRRS